METPIDAAIVKLNALSPSSEKIVMVGGQPVRREISSDTSRIEIKQQAKNGQWRRTIKVPSVHEGYKPKPFSAVSSGDFSVTSPADMHTDIESVVVQHTKTLFSGTLFRDRADGKYSPKGELQFIQLALVPGVLDNPDFFKASSREVDEEKLLDIVFTHPEEVRKITTYYKERRELGENGVANLKKIDPAIFPMIVESVDTFLEEMIGNSEQRELLFDEINARDYILRGAIDILMGLISKGTSSMKNVKNKIAAYLSLENEGNALKDMLENFASTLQQDIYTQQLVTVAIHPGFQQVMVNNKNASRMQNGEYLVSVGNLGERQVKVRFEESAVTVQIIRGRFAGRYSPETTYTYRTHIGHQTMREIHAAMWNPDKNPAAIFDRLPVKVE